MKEKVCIEGMVIILRKDYVHLLKKSLKTRLRTVLLLINNGGVSMSKTYRWWNNIKDMERISMHTAYFINICRGVNPYWFRHDYKQLRAKLHRRSRRNNKIMLQKGIDIEIEMKTRGWETY